jgi:hypothetical protein
MDNPTRIGLGGTALFTLAGVGAPVLTWYVSAPIMALCAGVSVWGFWPVLSHPRIPRWPFGRVPIQDAALELYESAEAADALEFFIADGPNPTYKLETFKYVMMVDDEAVLKGKKPPSRKSLPIPSEELRGSLMPVENTNQLNHTAPHRVAYTDVTIGRNDLNRIKKQWPIEAKKEAAKFRSQ